MQKSYEWFWDCLARYFPLYRHVLVASVIVNLLSLAMPLYIMNVYDRIVPNNAFESLWVLSIGMVIATSLDVVLRGMRMYFVDLAGRNADIKMQSLFLKHLMNVRLDALYGQKQTNSIGAIIARVRELEYVREFLGSNTVIAIFDLPFTLFFIILIFMIGGTIGFIPLFAIPLLTIFAIFIQSKIEKTSNKVMHSNAIKQSFLTEMILGLETIRATRMENALLQLWDKYTAYNADSAVVARRHSNMLNNTMVYCGALLSISVVVLGVYRISDGLMTSGALIACVILFGRCLGPIISLVNILANLQKTLLSVKQLHLLLQLPTENPLPDEDDIANSETSLPDSSIAVPVTFERVYFSYPSSNQQATALQDIKMQIMPGSKLAFVGASGAGKSTLARLYAGIYSPTDGRVLLGNVDMRVAAMQPYRNKVGYLPQEIRIFRGTLRHNIALAWPFAGPCDEAQLMKAAELAGVLDFASQHPLGLDMTLGEQGVGLSGGQAQSVALARALLGDPHTIILDEPSAQLDLASEYRLINRLQPYFANKTVIICTHKATMLNLVNRVVGLDAGRIVWTGTTQEAIEQKRI